MLCLLIALGSLACGDQSATILFVNISAKPGVQSPASLDVYFTHQGSSQKQRLVREPNQKISLPTDFVIRADNRSGEVQVEIRAISDKDRVIAQAVGQATLLPDQQVNLSLVLRPYDWQLNARYKYDQIFTSTSATGRQLASDAKGNFVAVWEDQSPQLTQYDVWYRQFDNIGQARINAAFGDKEEHRVNKNASHWHDHPAVAMQRSGALSGYFVAAYQHGANPNSSDKDVRTRSFTATGKPDLADERPLSTTGNASAPDIACLANGQYMVVWQQEQQSHQKWFVKGRLLNSHGKPIPLPGTSADAPFDVTSFNQAGQSGPKPAVAPGKSGGFLVVWRQGGNLKASAYAAAGQNYSLLQSNFSIATAPTAKVNEFDVGPLFYGYAVTWADTRPYHDTTGTCIQLRRFDFQGKGLSAEYTVNITTAGNQRHPAIAMTDTGAVLVAWSSSHNDSADPLGGIRGRALLSNGLPLGSDFRLNTTTAKLQEKPAVAPHGKESFVAAYIDHSSSGPDTEGSSVRGRLIYPDFGAKDGEVGALCDTKDYPCRASLSCQPTQTGKRCVAICTGLGASCRHGGICTADKTVKNHFICLY